MYLIYILTATIVVLVIECQADGAKPKAAEGRAIQECLNRFGGLSRENAERLSRYKDWSEDYEEIPCFTKCYLSKMFNIYDELQGFNHENVVQQFGRPVFEKCRHHLNYERDSCDVAYKGLHCLVQHENDPFLAIDNMEKLDNEAKVAMKECLFKFDPYELEHFKDYAKFPVREPIPCYTKCFIDELQLYNHAKRQWQIETMRYKLGVPVGFADISNCVSMRRTRNRNACVLIYREFTCLVMAK